ncbi:MAG TPA: hypothetical protein VEL82_01005 [Thermoplasmata archaeon]|nr:hypothetical protein [Thermoplasmata archaeon]
MRPAPDGPNDPACLDRRCPHPPSDHIPTPELAARQEIVVWCAACRRHEVGRTPRRFAWLRRGSDVAARRRRFTGVA